MSSSLPSVALAVVLFALLASVTTTTVSSADDARLDSAIEELASLLRLAQREAMRTGNPHGVTFNPATTSFSVAQVKTTVEPFSIVAPTYHPIRKQPLTWQNSHSPHIITTARAMGICLGD